jgi:hypothetical protein
MTTFDSTFENLHKALLLLKITQNSVDLAWESLMEPRFSDLRNCIYQNTPELKRFRQLLVNTVLATDIFDSELQSLRKNRWEKAFNTKLDQSDKQLVVNRKATIVIEHLIQASDIAHTMQHWHIYQKWNERLFDEMMKAYKAGRSGKDPAPGWYQGELGFFDNYIIPLARKLKDCGVFGVSSDEYLNYALENRREWSTKGEEVVKRMMAKYDQEEEEEETTPPPPTTEQKKFEPAPDVASTDLESSPEELLPKDGDDGSETEKSDDAAANASPYENANH